MVSGNAWYAETAQVQDWLAILKDPFTSQPVLEVSTGSFWTNFRTYRLLYLGTCWAVAKFPSKNLGPTLSYRILSLSAIRLTRLEDGKLDLEIDGRSIRGVPLSPQLNQHVASLIASGV